MSKWQCTICGHVFDSAQDKPDHGIKNGTALEDLPDDRLCPDCGVGKDLFEKID